jgi:hypothetical protein
MPFEEIDTESSGNSMNDVSALDDNFARMQFESLKHERRSYR